MPYVYINKTNLSNLHQIIERLEKKKATLRAALKDGVEYFEADYLGEEAAKMVKGWEDLLEETTPPA